jgi:hypothetical protein
VAVRIPKTDGAGERPGVGIATVLVTNYAHRLAQVVHIDDKQAEPGIEGAAIIVHATLGAGQRDRVAIERGGGVGHFTQQHVVAIHVLLTPSFVVGRVLVQMVASECILRKRLGQDGKGWVGEVCSPGTSLWGTGRSWTS